MKRLVVMYGAIHVNVLLVSFYLVGWLNGAWLHVLQVTFLALLLWGWKR
ncbi:MAG: CPBP family intramembrane glutamate endopeptidase, partial [Streptococcus suis]